MRSSYTRKKKTQKKRKTRMMRTKTHHKKKKGGLKLNQMNCDNEGYIFYPSVITGSPEGITKIYRLESTYHKELRNYKTFDKVDPEHKYHCRIYSHDDITPNEELQEKAKEKKCTYKLNEPSYKYIDMEYAGDIIGDVTASDNNASFKKSLIRFIVNVLNLRTAEGKYLVHGDPHYSNICYKKDSEGNYIIKYIDITELILVDPDEVIPSISSNIRNQFSSLLGGLQYTLGYGHKLLEELPSVNSMEGRKYGEVISELSAYLNNNIDMIEDTVGSPARATASSRGPPSISRLSKNKRKLYSDSPPDSPVEERTTRIAAPAFGFSFDD